MQCAPLRLRLRPPLPPPPPRPSREEKHRSKFKFLPAQVKPPRAKAGAQDERQEFYCSNFRAKRSMDRTGKTFSFAFADFARGGVNIDIHAHAMSFVASKTLLQSSLCVVPKNEEMAVKRLRTYVGFTGRRGTTNILSSGLNSRSTFREQPLPTADNA